MSHIVIIRKKNNISSKLLRQFSLSCVQGLFIEVSEGVPKRGIGRPSERLKGSDQVSFLHAQAFSLPVILSCVPGVVLLGQITISEMYNIALVIANVLSVIAPLIVAHHNFTFVEFSLWFWFHPWYAPGLLRPSRSLFLCYF